jgi:hypothetical protein
MYRHGWTDCLGRGFTWRVVVGLGGVWILDGLTPTPDSPPWTASRYHVDALTGPSSRFRGHPKQVARPSNPSGR